MNVTKIETFHTQHLCVVRLTTDDGLTGWGQTAHLYTDITSAIVHRMLAPVVLGMDCGDIEAVNNACIESTYKFYGSFINRAAAGIDTALWDIRAKRAGKSVAGLLGVRRNTMDIYASSMDRRISPQQEADRMERLGGEKGFRAFKLHIATGIGRDEEIYPHRTEEAVSKVRRAIGDNAALYVDPNGAYTVPRAIEMAKVFKEYGVGFFEEPCPFWEYEKSAAVAKAIDIPVAGGEQDYCLAQWQRIIDCGAVAIAQPDICYIGGLTRALRVAEMAEKAGMPCTPHNGTFTMLQVFSVHFNAVIPNAYPFMEWSIDQNPWTKDFFYPQFNIIDGKVTLPQEPGWGVQINPEWLRNAAYTVSDK